MRARLLLFTLVATAGSLAAFAFTPTALAVRPGLVVERHTAPEAPEVPVGDRQITIVRVDLRAYRLRFLTESRHGARRPAPAWARDHHLAGVTNAGMFLPSGRSVGYMVQDGDVVSNRRVTKYRGFVGFEERRGDPRALAVGGPRCGSSTVDTFTARFRNVLQAYLLVDCEGNAVPWPNRKRFSAAAFGRDREGRAVFVHVRTPYRMDVFNRMMASPAFGIRGLIYLEGGPEATLYVDAEGQRVTEVGSYETGFYESDANRAYWDLPNVVAFQARTE
ncbi:MAG: phosphodiester glycosidase family protein [Myxococcales bacterium]|nr:phosphodiester glycosidase family protein [Myxococcales bacterium]